MQDEQLIRATWRGMAEFQRVIGRHGPDASLLERGPFVASAVPSVAASLINAAVPLDGAPLAPHLDELAAFYADAPKWGAWIDPASTAEAEALTRAGLVLDSTPVLMATELHATRPPDPDVVTPSLEEVGQVNDAAYDTPQPHIARTLAAFPPDAFHAYGLAQDGTLACVLLILDVDDDAFVTLVATLPDHRGKRLASNLLAHALNEAAQGGQTTTSLQASKQGQSIYARLGYRPLGEVHLWEQR